MKDDKRGTLVAYGRGEVKVRPDIGTVFLAVVTEARTATEASRDNAARMQAVIEAVLGAGVGKDAIRTIGLNLYPLSRFDEDERRAVIDGYRAQNTIAVTVQVDLVGNVFDVGIGAGANVSGGIEYGIEDEQPIRDRALDLAVESARGEAGVIAGSLCVKIVGPQEVEIEQAGGRIAKRLELASRDAVSTPVIPGEITVSARVRVTYAFRQ